MMQALCLPILKFGLTTYEKILEILKWFISIYFILIILGVLYSYLTFSNVEGQFFTLHFRIWGSLIMIITTAHIIKGPYSIVDQIYLDHQSIRIENLDEVFGVLELESIELKYYGYRCQFILLGTSFEVKRGYDNRIKFCAKGKDYEFPLLFRKRKEFHKLSNLVLDWLNQGVRVRFYQDDELSTYLSP